MDLSGSPPAETEMFLSAQLEGCTTSVFLIAITKNKFENLQKMLPWILYFLHSSWNLTKEGNWLGTPISCEETKKFCDKFSKETTDNIFICPSNRFKRKQCIWEQTMCRNQSVWNTFKYNLKYL